MIRWLRLAATPALACSLGAAARPGWPLRHLLLPASLCWTSGPTAGHAQVASAPARVGPDLACAGAGLGGVPSGSLPGRSAWLPGSWVALVYRCPKEEGPSEHWRESPLRPASHSEGAHQDSGKGERAEGGCRDEPERSSEAAPGTRVALCPPVRAATRSRQQEWADERCGAPATHPPTALPLCNAASGRGLWGGTQRKTRDGANRIRTVGPEPRACTGPTAALPQVGCGCFTCSLSPAGGKFPQTRPGAPGRAGWTASDWSSAAQDTAGQRGRGPGGAEEGCGAARVDASWTHVLPRWVPVLPCLSLPSYGMGAGGRVWRHRGQAEAWSRVRGLPRPGFAVGSHLQAAPTNAAPGRGS